MTADAALQSSTGKVAHFAAVVRSELVKVRSVRSTYWTLGLAIAFNVGLAALLAIFLPGQLTTDDKAALDTTRVTLGGIHLSQVAFGVLGVLVITSEYGTGMIRASLSAVPQRRLFLAAKVSVYTALAVPLGVASSLGAFLAFQAVLSDDSLRSSIGDPGVLRALIGGGLFLTLVGLLGLGLGAITRSSTGAIAVLFSLLFVPSLLLHLLPESWNTTIGPYAPMEAGTQIFSLNREGAALAPWAGLGVFALYVVVALGLGLVLINRRDA